MKGLILVADGFEDVQLFHSWYRLREEGIRTTLATLTGRSATGKHGYRVRPDSPITELNPTEYDVLVLPGGESPSRLRVNELVVDITRTFMEDRRGVAAIAEGPQLLISAGCLDGRIVTCDRAIRDDVRAAGAEYRDEAAILDGTLLTCRGTDDLPDFGKLMVSMQGVRT